MPFWEMMDNITLTLSNSSSLISTCTSSIESTQNGMGGYIASFPDLTNYLLSFLMNLTGNVINFVNIFNNI